MSRTYKDQPTTVKAARNGDTVSFVDNDNKSLHGEELTGKQARDVLLERKKDQYDDNEKEKFIINDNSSKKDENEESEKTPPRTHINQELHDAVKEYNSTLRSQEQD